MRIIVVDDKASVLSAICTELANRGIPFTAIKCRGMNNPVETDVETFMNALRALVEGNGEDRLLLEASSANELLELQLTIGPDDRAALDTVLFNEPQISDELASVQFAQKLTAQSKANQVVFYTDVIAHARDTFLLMTGRKWMIEIRPLFLGEGGDETELETFFFEYITGGHFSV